MLIFRVHKKARTSRSSSATRPLQTLRPETSADPDLGFGPLEDGSQDLGPEIPEHDGQDEEEAKG